MISEVLRILADSGGAPVTQIRKALDLPAELAAHLCIQLQDAGFVTEWELEPCHHQDGESSCTHCSGASCADESGRGHHMAEILTADDFKQGCCGMNAPYHITAKGRAYLQAHEEADMDQVFSRYYRENRWGNPESRSGKGSSLAGSQYVRDVLPRWFRTYGIRRLLDAPCGDFYWMQHVVAELDEYVGADIVAELVQSVADQFGRPGVRFMHADITRDPLPQMDAALCRDFLGHLPLALGRQALSNLKRSGATYLISHSDPGENCDVPVGGFVWINLCAPPFDFPDPLASADEPHNGGKNVRRIGIWRFSDLPL